MGLACIAAPDDSGTITGSATAGAMPVSNLLTMQPTNRVSTATFTDPSAVSIVVEYAESAPRNLVWLGFHNGTGEGTWRIRNAPTVAELTSAPTHDSGTLGLWPAGADLTGYRRRDSYLWLGDSPWSDRCWRIDVSDPDNPAGVLVAGRAYICQPWQATGRSIDYGPKGGDTDEPVRQRAEGGNEYPRARVGKGFREFRLSAITKADMLGADGLYPLLRRRGSGRDLLYIEDPDDTAYFQERRCYGILRGMPQHSADLPTGEALLYSITITMEGLV